MKRHRKKVVVKQSVKINQISNKLANGKSKIVHWDGKLVTANWGVYEDANLHVTVD